MRLSAHAKTVLAAAVIVLFCCSASHAVSFWLSHDASEGSFGEIDVAGETLNETIKIVQGEPVVLTIWATLEGVMDLRVITLGLNMDSMTSLESNAVWIFNAELNTANTFRHQITLASDPADFLSADLPPAGDASFPFCNDQGCQYSNPTTGMFGGASIGEPIPQEGGPSREGVGIGAMASGLGDGRVVHYTDGNVSAELWKIGVIEFLSMAEGTTTLELYEGDSVGSGTGPPWDFISLDLAIAFISGDFDADGDVDGGDFLDIQRKDPNLTPAWEATYGTLVGGSTPAGAMVPESSSIWLAALALALSVGVRRPRPTIV